MQYIQKIVIVVSILLLLAATIKISEYGYYQFLRIWVTLVGGYFCYNTYKTRNHNWSIIFTIIIVLFNPLYPIYLEKETWQIVDVICAITFFIFYKNNINE